MAQFHKYDSYWCHEYCSCISGKEQLWHLSACGWAHLPRHLQASILRVRSLHHGLCIPPLHDRLASKHPRCASVRKRQALKYFRMCDADGSGEIDLEEFKVALFAVDPNSGNPVGFAPNALLTPLDAFEVNTKKFRQGDPFPPEVLHSNPG